MRHWEVIYYNVCKIVQSESLQKSNKSNCKILGGRAKTEIVTLLLKHDRDDVRSSGLEPLVNVKDSIGKTILHYAASSKKPELISLLLSEFDADPNVTDAEGCTPLHLISSQGMKKPLKVAYRMLIFLKTIYRIL